MDAHDSREAAIATLNTRVASIEEQLRHFMASVTSQIGTVAAEVKQMGRTNWPIIFGVVGIGWGVYTNLDQTKLEPFRANDAALQTSIKEITKELKETMVPLWVHQREWSYRESQLKAQDDRTKLVEENTAQRIKRLETMFGQTWNLRDAIQQLTSNDQAMQQRLSRIEQEAWKAATPAEKRP